MNLMILIERYFMGRYLKRHNAKAAVSPYGRLQISTWLPNPNCSEGEKLGSLMSRTCLDPMADLNTISAALELKTAILKRRVHITPDRLYQHIIGCEYGPRNTQWQPAGPSYK